MISPAQQRGLRALLAATLAARVGEDDTIPTIELARVLWIPQGHMQPRAPSLSLQIIGAEDLDPDGERINRATGTGDDMVLEQIVRTHYLTTLSVQLAVEVDPADPMLVSSAWILARRMLVRMRTDEAASALTAIGVSVERTTGIRDLSGVVRGSHYESRVAVDLALKHAVLDVHEPGWIERVVGSGTLSDGVDALLTVGFDVTTEG